MPRLAVSALPRQPLGKPYAAELLAITRSLLCIALCLLSLEALAQASDGQQPAARRPKIGLVLSGGGARGVAHVGVLKVLNEMRIPVDGRMVVTRTRDGGESFDVLGRGLPDRHAYHLVYRHALDVDASGDRLAMGSTTGSVWVSEDAGNAWSLVSTTLPPVACIRWAA